MTTCPDCAKLERLLFERDRVWDFDPRRWKLFSRIYDQGYEDGLMKGKKRRQPPRRKIRQSQLSGPMVECLCGCGGTFHKFRDGRLRQFVTGHNTRLEMRTIYQRPKTA